MDREVTLEEMLAAREARVLHQQTLLERYGTALVCFTQNIAGPIKQSALIGRAFALGCALLEEALADAGLIILWKEAREQHTGCEAFYVVDGAPHRIKRSCTAIEEGHSLGRLFDLDVLAPDGLAVSRQALSLPPRCCMICGAPGKGCASRRIHSVAQLQEATTGLLRGYFARRDVEQVAGCAAESLLTEVATTPKPGLVDRANRGSHQDMDFFTFLRSTAAITPYLHRCVEAGQETAALPPDETFARLRRLGKEAEREMFAATGGVNTHKGAIFSMGILCGAMGRLWSEQGNCRSLAAVCSACARISERAVWADLAAITPETACTAGQRLYLFAGLTGIRGELAAGLPSVLQVGMPALRRALDAGCSLNDAGAIALLYLIASVEDTNNIARSNRETGRGVSEQVRQLLLGNPLPDQKTIHALDEDFIARNLSPGGCADLLAICYLCYLLGLE